MPSPRPSLVRAAALLSLAVSSPGCAKNDTEASVAVPRVDGGSRDALPPDGHSVGADMKLVPDADGETLTFLTPALSTFSMPASDVIGKPYYVATFVGGFDQGVDLDLHHEWGTVPGDLHVTYASPPKFQNGPYDVALIVYTHTEITDAIRKDYFTVVPKSGELSAFTLSQDRVKPGDPKFSNGVIRVNVEDADAELQLSNKHDAADVGASQTDTVLTVP
jgi:hypothetical protein